MLRPWRGRGWRKRTQGLEGKWSRSTLLWLQQHHGLQLAWWRRAGGLESSGVWENWAWKRSRTSVVSGLAGETHYELPWGSAPGINLLQGIPPPSAGVPGESLTGCPGATCVPRSLGRGEMAHLGGETATTPNAVSTRMLSAHGANYCCVRTV